MDKQQLSAATDDHALETVPESARHGWLRLTWSTAGIVTTLIQMFVGALVTFVAGIKIGIIAGLFVTVVGALLGWGLGHIAYRSGYSSTVMARNYGFGIKGSIIASLIFGFMIIGFLALENVLLYKGFLFYFGLADTLANRALIYGILSLAWILLTAYGFEAVSKVSSITLVCFLGVLAFMVFRVIDHSGQSWAQVLSFGAQLPPEALQVMGATTDVGKFIFCVNVLIGSAGALALVDADLGRYSRSSIDIGIAALLGNLFMDGVMLVVGGVVMYAGSGELVDYYIKSHGMSQEQAMKMTLQSPDSVAAAFIVFGGFLGAVLMVLAQSKAQVLNTYSASLALTNLSDAIFNWRPGRLLFVVVANIVGLLMLYGRILELFNAWITVLGVLTTCFAGIILADYFIVRRFAGYSDGETVNWSGVATTVMGFVLSHFVLNEIVPIEFFTALFVSLILYPLLRLVGLRRGRSVPSGVASMTLLEEGFDQQK